MKNIKAPSEKDFLYYKNLAFYAGKNYFTWLEEEVDLETKKLFNLICARALKNRWIFDVISRKGAICHGKGNVHYTDYDFNI